MEDLINQKVPSDKVLEYTGNFISFLESQAGWSTIFSGLQVHYGAAAEVNRDEDVISKQAQHFNLELDYQIFTSWELCDSPMCPCFGTPEVQLHPTLAAQLLYGLNFSSFEYQTNF